MHPMLNIAIQAIRQAGNFLIKQYDIVNKNNINTTEYKNNLLVNINKKIEQLTSNIIKKYYPLHTIITQNNYNHPPNNNQDIQWIIYPLDSQINFIKQFPYFALSISIKIKGKTEISVVYDPIHNDLFSAIRGQGTQLNGYRIHHYITKKTHHNCVIISYFPYYKQHIITNQLNKLYKIQKHINFRYSGAITLDLAYVAVGRIDVLFIINIKTHNLNKETLLIQEAGGLIINLNNDDHIYKNMIIGNPKIIKYIIEKEPILK